MARTDRRRLWRAWFVSVTVGELVGFGVPAVAGAVTATMSDLVAVVALVAAGGTEGAVLGWAQARVLRGVLPGLAVGPYVGATAAAAALAYAIGMSPAVFAATIPGVPRPVLVVVGLLLAGALLASIGTAQWIVLRRVLPRSASWILTTGGSWAVALLAFATVTTPLWRPGQSVALVVAIGLLGGLVMAAVAAALTGAAVVRLVGRVGAARTPRSSPSVDDDEHRQEVEGNGQQVLDDRGEGSRAEGGVVAQPVQHPRQHERDDGRQ
jgi:hypothetical protein